MEEKRWIRQNSLKMFLVGTHDLHVFYLRNFLTLAAHAWSKPNIMVCVTASVFFFISPYHSLRYVIILQFPFVSECNGIGVGCTFPYIIERKCISHHIQQRFHMIVMFRNLRKDFMSHPVLYFGNSLELNVWSGIVSKIEGLEDVWG